MYLRQLSWPLIIQKFVQIDTPFYFEFRDTINTLPTSFSRSVLLVTEPGFFRLDVWPAQFPARPKIRAQNTRSVSNGTDLELGQ